MKTTKTLGLLSLGLIFGILLISAVSMISAQTLVAGKIYNSNFDDVIAGADVHVTCNSDYLNTKTLDDGTYAVRFGINECDENSTAEVTASKTGLSTKTASGEVKKCDGNDINCGLDSLFTIVNLGLGTGSSSNTGGHSSSGRYYNCGNNKCDSGESVATCPKDCKPIVPIVNQTQNTSATVGIVINDNGNEEEQNTTETLNQIPPTTQGGLSGITGAVIGAAGKLGTGWIIIIIFIVGVLGLSLVVRFIRKRKTITETI